MKRASLVNLIGLMVMAGWSRSDIVNLLEKVKRARQSELRDILDRLDSGFNDVDHYLSDMKQDAYRIRSVESLPAMESLEFSYPDHYVDSPLVAELHSKIQEMIFDFGLSTHEVVDLISEEIVHINGTYPPALSKKSLRSWVSRLLSTFTPGEILHACTNVRSRFQSGSKPGWSIRD